MTLAELKRRTQEARVAMGDDGFLLSPYLHKINNLRQMWVMVSRILARVDVDPSINYSNVADDIKNMRAFYKAGELYYYAKKHGLQAAMLRKLSDAG